MYASEYWVWIIMWRRTTKILDFNSKFISDTSDKALSVFYFFADDNIIISLTAFFSVVLVADVIVLTWPV